MNLKHPSKMLPKTYHDQASTIQNPEQTHLEPAPQKNSCSSGCSRGGRAVLTAGIVVVDVDALQLQLRRAHVVAVRVDAVFVRDHLPELRGKTSQVRTQAARKRKDD